MQRTEAEGIVISCDFCHADWDGQSAMVEGHHGSVLCLDCLKKSLEEARPGEGKYHCTLCLRDNIPAALPRWWHKDRPEVLVCHECILQAAKAFSRADHVDFQWKAED